ncbi:MAG: site-specific integrase [Thermoplasmata archaeon]|nr:site-specific integrase [Thermoplasmata archaeon]
MTDIHGVEPVISERLRALKAGETIGANGPISHAARQAILDFAAARRDEVSSLRLRTYLVRLPQIAARLGDDFLSPNRGTTTKFKAGFPAHGSAGRRKDQASYSSASREGSWYVACAFWRWYFGRKGARFPDEYLKLKIRKDDRPRIGPAEVLTRDDVVRIAEETRTLRDRAWVFTLYGSRCRPGELYRLRIGDVVRHDGYLSLSVHREKGSGERPALVYEDAVPALLSYLDTHPRKNEPEAPLWVSTEGHGKKRGEIVSYRELYGCVKEAADRAGITKPTHPYAFRHAGLTELAKNPSISQSILSAAAGWTQGSRRAATYVHISNKDVEAVLNATYGIAPAVESTKPTTRPAIKCPRCGTMAGADAAFCIRCGGPLSLEGAKQAESQRVELDRLGDLLDDPGVRRFLARRLAAKSATATQHAI